MRAKSPAVGLLLGLVALAGARTVYIRAGHVFDGQQLLEPRIIVVRHGVIQTLLPADAPTPDSVEQIDAADCTVLPGFIDASVSSLAPPAIFGQEPERYSWGKPEAEWQSLWPDNRRSLLENGITATIESRATLGSCRSLRAALRKGAVVGPEVLFPGPVFTAPGGYPVRELRGRHDLLDNAVFQTRSPEQARAKVTALATSGVSFIALNFIGHRGAPRLDFDVAQAVITEAHACGLRVSARVGTEDEAWAMTRLGADGIEGLASASDSLLRTMSAKGVTITPLLAAHWSPTPDRATHTVKRAYLLGVPLCAGSGFPRGKNRCGDGIYQELDRLEELGIPRLEALKTATRNPALKLGLGRELGMIAPGYRANLVFMAGDITRGTLTAARIVRVMLHGETVVENRRIVPDKASGFRQNSLSVFGFPYWDPLLSWLVGGNITDYDLLRTGVAASLDIVASIRNMWFANLALSVPSPIPRTALKAGAHFDNQNRLFYGIGNDTRLDSAREYASVVFKEGIEALTRVKWEWKVKSSLTLDQSRLRPYRGDTLPEIPGSRGGNQALLGLYLIHDRRDHENNPRHGNYFAVGGQTSVPGISDHYFQRFSHDLRIYTSPFPGHVIATRLYFQLTFGDAPFYYYPDFGGDTLGRGYLPNRLRDRTGFYAQLEYRFPIAGPFSGVVFADAARFQTRLSEFSFTGIHPSVGFGPRYTTGSNENSIIGVDVGFTREGWNLVLHAGHAF
jgi:enamidase